MSGPRAPFALSGVYRCSATTTVSTMGLEMTWTNRKRVEVHLDVAKQRDTVAIARRSVATMHRRDSCHSPTGLAINFDNASSTPFLATMTGRTNRPEIALGPVTGNRKAQVTQGIASKDQLTLTKIRKDWQGLARFKYGQNGRKLPLPCRGAPDPDSLPGAPMASRTRPPRSKRHTGSRPCSCRAGRAGCGARPARMR